MPSHIDAAVVIETAVEECGLFKKKVVIKIKIIIKIGNETRTIEVEVKVEMFDMNKKELIDAIASHSKFTKANAERALDAAIEPSIKLRNFKVMEPEP